MKPCFAWRPSGATNAGISSSRTSSLRLLCTTETPPPSMLSTSTPDNVSCTRRRYGRSSTPSRRKAAATGRSSGSRSCLTSFQNAAQNLAHRLNLSASRWSRGGGLGILRQSQYLVEGPLVGDQIGLHQLLAGGG